jgi:hypothetical protein
MSEGFRMNLQDRYDREIVREQLSSVLKSIKPMKDRALTS